MKKSFNSTFALLGLLAVLLGWYLIYERSYRPAAEKKEESSKILISTPREAIQELILEKRQGDENSTKYSTVHLKKTGSDWTLIAPVEDAADTSVVNGMINAAAFAKHERVVDEKPATLKPYGLENPFLKIHIKKDGSSPAELVLVGNNVPVGSGVYVKIAGKETVYRGAIAIRTSFDKEASEYRNKKVLPFTRNDVDEVEIKSSKHSFILRRSEKNGWMLSREGVPASESEVNKLVNGLTDLQAVGFASENGTATLGKFGLSPAEWTFTFTHKTGKTLLLVGHQGEKYYVKRGDKPVVYEVAKTSLDSAKRDAKSYHDRKLAHFNRFDVKRFRIEHGPESFELFKEGSEWKSVSDPKAQIETAKVEDYLSRLQDTKLGEYRKGATQLPKTDLAIHIFEKKGNEPEAETVTLAFSKSGEKVTGVRKGLDMPFSIDVAEFRKANAFRQEFLLTPPPPAAKPKESP